MAFFKDTAGFIMFLLCLSNLFLQFFFIYKITDEINNNPNIYLNIHKIINYILLLISIFSHIKTSIINPGEISNENNKEIIEFYYHIHEPLIKRALIITKKKTPEFIKKKILGENDKINDNQEKENEDENEENNSDKDDYNFEPKTSINDIMKKNIEDKNHMKLSRCINCFVIRPINSHHCSVCHKCYIEHDHHCPWVYNCIGLFNKKFFILFLSYSFLEVIYSDLLFFYYTLYKNINILMNNQILLILDIFAIIFGLILAIASVMLLLDQYDTIVNNCIQCDFKKGILLESSSIKQQFQIIFGGLFSYKWLLPFYPGGNKDFYKQIHEFYKLKESMAKKKIN